MNSPIAVEEEVEALGNQKIVCPIAAVEVFWLGEKREVEVIVNYGEDVLL